MQYSMAIKMEFGSSYQPKDLTNQLLYYKVLAKHHATGDSIYSIVRKFGNGFQFSVKVHGLCQMRLSINDLDSSQQSQFLSSSAFYTFLQMYLSEAPATESTFTLPVLVSVDSPARSMRLDESVNSRPVWKKSCCQLRILD